MNHEELLESLGHYGWIPPSERTPAQANAHIDTVASTMVPFTIMGKTDESEEKVDLTELWAHPSVVAALGYEFTGTHQLTGSCVGAGGGNMGFTVVCVDTLMKNEPERIIVPFWLLPYGRSRLYMGARSPGEGSLGSTFARAAKEDGFLDANAPGLPTFTHGDGLVWGANTERSWSDGDAQQTMTLLPESRKHIIQSVGEALSTADQLEEAIRNLYGVTNASSLIPNPSIGEDGEAYGRVASSGGHQTTFLGVWRHPKKGGRWFKYVNQWGLRWGKRGACWIPESDAVAIMRNGGETYPFSQHMGFPAQTFKWDI